MGRMDGWTDGQTEPWVEQPKTNDEITWQLGSDLIGLGCSPGVWRRGVQGSGLCFNVRNIKNYHKLTT